MWEERYFGRIDGVDPPSIYLLSVRVKAGVGEALALVFAEESAIPQDYVIDFVARTPAVKPVPFLLRLLTFPATKKKIDVTF